MNKQNGSGFIRIIKAGKCSMAGLTAALKHEKAFQQELCLVVILSPLALWLGEDGPEKAILTGSLFMILIAEIVNSAIEAVVDRFGGEIHPLSGRAKDLGSAAVFLAMVNAALVWLLIIFF